MRTPSFLCSLLAFVLSFIPDTPAQEIISNLNTVYTYKGNMQHSDEICSPFFPCAGCVAPIITKLFKYEYLVQILGISTFDVSGENKPIPAIYGIWQSPQ